MSGEEIWARIRQLQRDAVVRDMMLFERLGRELAEEMGWTSR